MTPAEARTRERLLDAARAHLDRHGLDGLTLRQIARDAGVSHGAPRRHFPTLGALLATIAADGFRRLHESVERCVAAAGPDAGPRRRLANAGRGYVRFALANPGAFALMFRVDLLDASDPEYLAAGAAAFEQICAQVAEVQADGFRPDVPTPTLAVAFWSAMHGFVQLWLLGAVAGAVAHVTGDPPGPESLGDFEDVLISLLLDHPGPGADLEEAP